MMTALPSSSNPVPLERCPECGYLLTGLPDRGRCPECGSEYAPGPIVLFGWGCGQQASVANARTGTAILRGLSTVLYVSLFAVLFLASYLHSQITFLWLLLISSGLLGFIIGIYRRRQAIAAELPLAQLRLAHQGFAQRDGFGPVQWKRWRRGHRLRLTATGTNRQRLRITWYLIRPVLVLSYPVDFEFESSPERAEGVLAQAQAWHHAVTQWPRGGRAE